MKNPYYYLFYKLNNLINRKGNNEWGVIFGLSVFVGWNLVVLYVTFLPITKQNYDGSYKNILVILLATIFIINSVLFLNKKRVKNINLIFENESKFNKILGNIIILSYIILSFLLILFI